MDKNEIRKTQNLDRMSGEQRQMKIKSFQGCGTVLPEYRNKIDKEIHVKREAIRNMYVFTETYYEFISADKQIQSEFDLEMNFKNFPSEYYFVVEERFRDRLIYKKSIPFLFDYCGVLWDNILGCIYVILHDLDPKSSEFETISEKYSVASRKKIDLTEFLLRGEDFVFKKMEIFFKHFFKCPSKHFTRYLSFYQEDIIKRGGLSFMSPELGEFLNKISPELLDRCNESFICKIQAIDPDELPQDTPPQVSHNIRLPRDVPSKDANKDLPPYISMIREWDYGILIFKVVPDTVSDESRFSPQVQPYRDSAYYKPPVVRDVSTMDQPYRYQLVNSTINYDDLHGDTMSMRKVVAMDFLTKTLDWAAKKGLPLPALGSEVFIHMGDAEPEGATDMYMGCYARQRKYSKYLQLFPEYSWQVFSPESRFDIRDSYCSSWDETKKHIVGKIESEKIRPTIRKMFFRGNEVSLSGIRRQLWYMQKHKIKNALPPGILQIEIPKLDGKKDPPPMSISDMSKYKVLLDLPGFGMWSTRTKFIALTDSHIIRIIFISHYWNAETGEWNLGNTDDDLTETFVDTVIPHSMCHTVFTDKYEEIGAKDPVVNEKRKQLNIAAKTKLVNKLAGLYKNLDKPHMIKKSHAVRDRMRSYTEDELLGSVYRFIMNQEAYYRI